MWLVSLLGATGRGVGTYGLSDSAAIREAVCSNQQKRYKLRPGDLRGSAPAGDPDRSGQDGRTPGHPELASGETASGRMSYGHDQPAPGDPSGVRDPPGKVYEQGQGGRKSAGGGSGGRTVPFLTGDPPDHGVGAFQSGRKAFRL